MMTKKTLTQELVKELLHYDPVTGVVTRKVKTCNRVKAGDVFGSKSKHRGKTYLKAHLLGKLYFVHRVIWFYMTGEWPSETDHGDGNGLNNCWGNLSGVTRVGNSQNHRLADNNTSGVVGVSLFKRTKGWYASIKVERENIYLGYHKDFFEAVCIRKSAENKHGFHRGHGSVRPL